MHFFHLQRSYEAPALLPDDTYRLYFIQMILRDILHGRWLYIADFITARRDG